MRLHENAELLADAETFRRRAAAEPNVAAHRLNLGVALARAGRGSPADATDHFNLVRRRWPGYLEGHLNLGKSMASRGEHVAAIAAFRSAARIDPCSVDALTGIGLSLAHLGRGVEAHVTLRQALRLEPCAAGLWSNLGFASAVAGDYDAAEASFRRALSIDPSLAEAHVNRGNAFKEQGRLGEAIACYDLALMLNRDAGSARWNRSLALLQQGRFAEGWPEYESRWDRDGGDRRRQCDAPPWDGSAPIGKSILIQSEQGLGDVVMFARYAAVLKAAGATVLLESPPPLQRVLRTCTGADRIVVEGDSPPPVDAAIPVMSLPWRCGTTLATVPGTSPYLRADPRLVDRYRREFSRDRRRVVGLVWQGNPSHPWDRHRSMSLQSLLPLRRFSADADFVSLQRGPGREQLRTAGATFIVDAIAELPREDEAVEHLAAQIAAVDLLITVDTMPAHLAGAVGTPVWTLLSTMVDWRWMCDRTDSPWYPTMRLFRQRRRDQWSDVVEGVCEALGSWLGQRNSTRLGADR